MRLVILVGLFAVAAGAQDQTGMIKGAVVDSLTHLPVSKAQVSISGLWAAARVTDGSRSDPHSVISDASGSFKVDGLKPGQYEVMVQHRRYPQNVYIQVNKAVAVKAGEEAAVTVELVPGAVLTGHIYDEDGDPLERCFVQAYLAKHPDRPMTIPPPSGNSSSEGEYRIFGLFPGKYIVGASCAAPVFQPRPLSAGPDPPPSGAYPKQYYPGVTSTASAEVIELAAGAERTGIDFRMLPARVSYIDITLAPGDWHGRNDLMAQLIPEGQSQPVAAHQIDTGKSALRIDKVLPGSYTLVVGNFGTGLRGNVLGATKQIAVTDKPASVVIPLQHGLDVKGTLTVEGAGLPDLKLNQLTIALIQEGSAGSEEARVNDDGTFLLTSAFPGRSQLRINQPHTWIKSAWLGNTELTDGKLDLSSGVEGDLRIVVSTDTATIQGTAAPGSQLGVVSSGNDDAWQGVRLVRADENGQFKLDGLAPGTYGIAALDGTNSFPDDGGQQIKLKEGQVAVVEVKAEARGQ